MNFPINMSIFLLFAIIFALAFYTYRGYRNGLVVEVIKTVTLILSAIGGWILSGVFNNSIMLVKEIEVETGVTLVDTAALSLANRGVLFLIFFIMTYIALRLIRICLKKLNNIKFVGSFNQVLGSVLGFVKGCILIVIFILILASPLIKNSQEVLVKSGLLPLKNYIQNNIPIAKDILNGFEALDNFINSELLP